MANHFTYHDQTINVGDHVAVHQKIVEEGKSRTQIFDGIIMGIKGRDINRTFCVRRISSNNIGVERVYPVLSPNIIDIKVKSRGQVRRAKLYYLRGRIGRKAIRVKEKKLSASAK